MARFPRPLRELSVNEYIYSKKDGTLIDVEISSALLKDTKGNITGSVATIRDITERKKTEKEIIKQDASIAKNYLNGIWMPSQRRMGKPH